MKKKSRRRRGGIKPLAPPPWTMATTLNFGFLETLQIGDLNQSGLRKFVAHICEKNDIDQDKAFTKFVREK